MSEQELTDRIDALTVLLQISVNIEDLELEKIVSLTLKNLLNGVQ